LRKIGRQELAWVTIPALAILAATAIYLSSERHRPRNFGVDEMAVYRMDDQSSMASAFARIRVSSPSRADVTPQVPASWTYLSENRRNPGEIFQRSPSLWLSEIRVGDRWESTFSLRRWSFTDLTFHSYRRFAGRVYRDSVGHLHNETGLAFGQAIVVD